jgi:hypothetical protein
MNMARGMVWMATAAAVLFAAAAHGQSGGIDIPSEQPPARERRGEPERPATAEREIDLRPRFEKGQQLRYTMEMTSSSSVVQPKPRGPTGRRPGGAIAGSEESTRNKVEFGLLLRVMDVNPEREATVDIVLERIKFKSDGPDGVMEFDSSAPAGSQDDLMTMMLGSIVGTTMTATIDRTGNIKSMTGGERLAALGQVGMPGAGDGTGGGAGGGLFGSIFAPKAGRGFARIGESWENEDVIESGLLGKFRMNTKHTLRRMQGRDALLDVRGSYRLDSEAGGSGMAKIKDSSYSGNYTWDTQAGSLKQMNTTMVTTAEQTIGEETREIRSESAVKVTRGN